MKDFDERLREILFDNKTDKIMFAEAISQLKQAIKDARPGMGQLVNTSVISITARQDWWLKGADAALDTWSNNLNLEERDENTIN